MKVAVVCNCWLLFQRHAVSLLIKAACLRTGEDYSVSFSGGLFLPCYRNCRSYSKCIKRCPAEVRATIGKKLQRDGLIPLVYPAKSASLFIKCLQIH